MLTALDRILLFESQFLIYKMRTVIAAYRTAIKIER